MLTRLQKGLRLKAALVLAALYAFCVLTPAIALAVTNAAAHCLTDAHDASHLHQAPAKIHAKTHEHADGTMHQHADDGMPQQGDGEGKLYGNCCGLFCVAAMAQAAPLMLATPAAGARTVPALAEALSGRGPDRINRPPIG